MRGQLHVHEGSPARLCRHNWAPAGWWEGFIQLCQHDLPVIGNCRRQAAQRAGVGINR